MEISQVGANGSSASDIVQATKPVSAPERKVEVDSDTPIMSSEFLSFNALKQTEQVGGQIAISDQQVLKAIERAIKAIEGTTTSLQFTVHEKTKHIAVKVLNKETGEVIREIPPEKNLDFLASLWEKAGILVDERR